MARDHAKPDLDRELDDLPAALRWREWMRRIEAVLFASAVPVPREDLARVAGQGVSVDPLIDDLIADLEGRSFEVAKVAGGWILRTRPAYATANRAAVDLGEQHLDFREYDIAVLAAIHRAGSTIFFRGTIPSTCDRHTGYGTPPGSSVGALHFSRASPT